MISIIVAIDDKRGIGRDNDLLFRIPQDFKRMKQITSGHPIIMGRRTFQSIGRILPNRTNIIISRNIEHLQGTEGAVYAKNLEDAITQAKNYPGSEEIFIFGGGMIFKEAIEKNLVDRLYLTIVKGDYHADTFFPEYPHFTKEIEKVEKNGDGHEYTFLTLEK